MGRDAFFYLMKHEMRRWKRGGKFRKSGLIYFFAMLAVGFACVTYFSVRGNFRMNGLVYVAYGFPYMIVGMSNYMVSREWSKGTLGWWLTLPYPRGRLIGAKFAAALAQSLLLYALLFAGSLLLGAYAKVLSPTAGTLHELFVSLVPGYLLLMAVTPFLIAYGMFMAVLQAKLVALAPLLWAVFGIAASFGTQGVPALLKTSWGGPVALLLAGSLVLAYALGKVMTKLLEQNVRV